MSRLTIPGALFKVAHPNASYPSAQRSAPESRAQEAAGSGVKTKLPGG